MNICAAMHVTFVFFNLIRDENTIAKKGTSDNAEKLGNQLFKERCSENKIIDDCEKACDQVIKNQEMWKDKFNKDCISHVKLVEKIRDQLK